MGIDRRKLLSGGLSIAGTTFLRKTGLGFLGTSILCPDLPSYSLAASATTDKRQKIWIHHKTPLFSAYKDQSHSFGLAIIGSAGKVIKKFSLPKRAHGISTHPTKNIVAVFSRRHGEYIGIISSESGKQTGWIKSKKNHCFTGHGAYSLDGKTLFAGENDFTNARGVIGKYSVRDNYQRIGEIPSGGVGVHEILISQITGHLIIANGGVLTHPDFGRAKLNLATMSPSICVINPANGLLIDKYKLPRSLFQHSIRHFDISNQGQIVVGLQYYGKSENFHPMIAILDHGSLKLVSLPKTSIRAMRNYCGSIKFDMTGNYVLASSPKGGVVTLLEKRKTSFSFKKSFGIIDVCGVMAGKEAGIFTITSGQGKIFELRSNTGELLQISNCDLSFDNHLS